MAITVKYICRNELMGPLYLALLQNKHKSSMTYIYNLSATEALVPNPVCNTVYLEGLAYHEAYQMNMLFLS